MTLNSIAVGLVRAGFAGREAARLHGRPLDGGDGLATATHGILYDPEEGRLYDAPP
jgi:hypothetical protein